MQRSSTRGMEVVAAKWEGGGSQQRAADCTVVAPADSCAPRGHTSSAEEQARRVQELTAWQEFVEGYYN